MCGPKQQGSHSIRVWLLDEKRKRKRGSLVKVLQGHHPRKAQLIPKLVLRKRRSFSGRASKFGRGSQLHCPGCHHVLPGSDRKWPGSRSWLLFLTPPFLIPIPVSCLHAQEPCVHGRPPLPSHLSPSFPFLIRMLSLSTPHAIFNPFSSLTKPIRSCHSSSLIPFMPIYVFHFSIPIPLTSQHPCHS